MLITILSCNIFAQKQDTIVIIDKQYTYLTDIDKALSMDLKGDTIFIVKKANDNVMGKAWDILNKHPFCYIYDGNKHLMEAGTWFGEGFNGEYVSYYKNGKVRSKGGFNYNNKIGKWFYYDEKGNLIKEQTY